MPTGQEWIAIQADQAKGMASDPAAPTPPPGYVYFRNPGYRPGATTASNIENITRPDGSVWRVDKLKPDEPPQKILDAGGKPLGVNTVSTNTTDQYIVTVDQKTGELVPVFNPNYVPPKPGQISTNTTDQFIVRQDASGTLSTTANPNYVPPKASTIAPDTASKFIVQQQPDGTIKTIANPNYQAKTPTVVGSTADTSSQFILQQQPDGTLKQLPNPNYVPKTPTVVGTDTTSPFIVRQKADGSIEQIANPNYKPKPTTITTDTSSPYIVQQQPDGTMSQVVNPNYVAPKPTVVNTQGNEQYITTMDAQGKISTQPNPSFVPKSPAEIAARAQQIDQIAQAKKNELLTRSQSDPNYTNAQALSDFNTWYDQNVSPQIKVLDAAQQAAQQEQAKQIADMRTAAQAAATNAGTLGVNAFNALREARPVGPGFGAAAAQIAQKSPFMKGLGADAFTWQGPNPVELAQQQQQNALKYIDPTMAQGAGVPPPNLQAAFTPDMLARDRYFPGGAPPPPAAPVGATAGAGAGTGGLPTDQWLAERMQNQANDVAAQRIQAGVPMPGAAPANQVPGQNYGAATAYTGGVMPWNWDPSMYSSNYSPFG